MASWRWWWWWWWWRRWWRWWLSPFIEELPRWRRGEESACNAGATGDAGLIPEWGRSPGGGHGSRLPCSFLENPTDRGVWHVQSKRVAKSWTWLKWLSTHVRSLKISCVPGNMLSASHFSNILRGYPFIPMLEVSRVNQTEEKLTHPESQTLSDKEVITN